MTDTPRREIDERLADWVDGRMSERERERFLAELRVNPQLQRDLEQYERTVGTVRAALRAPIAPSPIADRVFAALARGREAPVHEHPRWTRRHVGWSLASAAALLACAWWIHDWSTPAPSTAPVASLENARAPATDQVEQLAEAPADPAGVRLGRAEDLSVAGDVQPAAPEAKKPDAEAAKQAAQETERRFVEGEKRAESSTKLESGENESLKHKDRDVPAAGYRGAAPGSGTGGAPGRALVAGAPGGADTQGLGSVGIAPTRPAGPTTGGPGEKPGEKVVAPPAKTAEERKQESRQLGANPPNEPAGATLLNLHGEAPPSEGRDAKPGAAAAPAAPAPRDPAGAAPKKEPMLAFVLLEGDVAPARAPSAAAGRGAAKSPELQGSKAENKADSKSGGKLDDASRGEAKGDAGADEHRRGLPPLDAAGLRQQIDRFLASAADATVEPAADRWVTKHGAVDVAPWLGEVREQRERGAADEERATDKEKEADRLETDKKDGKAPAIERTWLVEGPKDDVQEVLARLRAFADARHLTLRPGEIAAPPDKLRDGDAAADDRPKPDPSAPADLFAAFGRATVDRTRVVLRLRLHAR
jgi:hypothetical protein